MCVMIVVFVPSTRSSPVGVIVIVWGAFQSPVVKVVVVGEIVDSLLSVDRAIWTFDSGASSRTTVYDLVEPPSVTVVLVAESVTDPCVRRLEVAVISAISASVKASRHRRTA